MLNFGLKGPRNHDNVPKASKTVTNDRSDYVSGISKMINSLNVDNTVELSVDKPERLATKENAQLDAASVQHQKKQYLIPEDALQTQRDFIPGRGQKRRCSSVSNDTPKSALDKCMRSNSPTMQKELQEMAATLLKPSISDNVFKVPHSSNSARGDCINYSKSPSRSSRQEASLSSREYVTAMSMNSPVEKLSLPSYGIVRPENIFTSPTSSMRSGLHLSPDSSREGQLKRTVSQLSNGSEFHDDVLPIKMKKSQKKLSWESVKLYQTVSKTVSIQNGSHKKLPLRVKVQGQGFSVTPSDDFRMIPNEARTFEVKFCPNAVGASCGQLIFELATNSKCMKAIPLYAYGGHTSIRFEGVQKGPVGPAFITMGSTKILNRVMEQQLTLKNSGTLPGFASLVFEKTKWSDFSLSESLTMHPSEIRLAPNQSVEVNVRFKATKEEVRKILTLNKEITIVGEICIISGDEPTRVRLLNNKEIVPANFLRFLPRNMINEVEIKRELILFNEDLDRAKLASIMHQIKTHEVALTVNRNLDETQIVATELSMADDTTMSFETFCDTNCTRANIVEAGIGDETE